MSNKQQFQKLFGLLSVCAIVLVGCTSIPTPIPLKNFAFPGRLLLYINGEGSNGQTYEAVSGQDLKLIRETQIKALSSQKALTVSQGEMYAIDQGQLVSLADGHTLNTLNSITDDIEPIMFSPDDNYIADAAGNVTELSTGKVIGLISPPCEAYTSSSGYASACLWFGDIFWLDNQTLLFVNDKSMLSKNYEFPQSIMTTGSNNGFLGVSSGNGNEVSMVDLNGKVQHISDDAKLIDFLSDYPFFQTGGDILMSRQGVWVSKQDLKRGVYAPHEIPPYSFDYPSLTTALSPKGRYYLRFPYDIVDLETGKTIDLNLFFDLQMEHEIKTSLTKIFYFSLLGGGEYFEFQINRKTYRIHEPWNCAWYLDEQHAVCGFNMNTDPNTSQTVIVLVFVSTTGTDPVITELIQPAATYISLEAWLP